MAYTMSGRAVTATTSGQGAYMAYQMLHFIYAAAPIVAGIDKFTTILADWQKYLAPQIPQLTGLSPVIIMMTIGAIEIVAGLIVAIRPRIGGYLVGFWLAGIIVNLLIHPTRFWDIALRDFGLMVGAFALASLARDFWGRRIITS